MKQACFYTKNNLHELEQSDLPTRRDEGMLVLPTQKKSLLKKWHYIFAFCLAMAFSSSLFAINLTVSGITESPYTDANGVYISQGTLNGAEYWKHQTKNYYIYYAPYSGGGVYWNLDVDTEDENDKPDEAGTIAGSTSSEVSTDPPIGISWVSGSSGYINSFSITIAEYSTVPEIDISSNGNSIISGDNTPSFADYTKFASTDVSGETSTRTYTIYNTGTVDALTVGTITIGGTNGADFTVTTSPGSPVSQSSSTTFTITFNPSASGERTATVSIVNNDSNENPYTFTISGYGYTSKNLVVSGINSTYAEANGIYIHQGVLNGFQYWKHSTLEYYIYYSLSFRYWIIDSNQNSGDNWLFSSFSELYSPSGLTYDPSLGAGPVAVNEEVAVPNINIKVGAYTISNGSATTLYYNNTNFGSLEVASGESTKSYTIENIGNATLTLSGASPYFTITGTNASDFSVATTPSNSILASGTTTFGITFNPNATGTRTATVTVLSNDADKPTYTFAIQGEGVTSRNLVVSNITAPSAANGTYIYQGILNEFQYWKHETESYYIFSSKLYGTSPVWYINSDLSADINTPLSYNFYSHTDYVSPVSVSSWTSASGSIGTPLIQYTEPEINITGNSANIISGDASPSLYDYTDLGWVVSGSISKTFTIQNTGISTLNLTGTSPYITFSGADASQFSITSIPSSTIAAGGSTTFEITFTPSSGTLGARTATLSILNDDSNENPYTFLVQSGVGTLPVVTTQAVSSIGTTTATGKGNVTSLGSPNPTSYGICYGTTINPDVTGSKTDIGTASATGAFPAQLTGLTQGTTYYARAFASNNVGTAYGTDVTFTTQNTVLSIVRVTSTPTNAASVQWTVTFAASLTGLTSTNFSLANTGLSSPSISSLTGSGTTWTVTANTGSGSGTLGLNMTNSTGLSTELSNPTFTGEVYTIDKTAPTVSSINRLAPSTPSTNQNSITYRVTFSENVTGVDVSNFFLTATDLSTGSMGSLSAVSGSVYDVTVNSISGDGTLRLDLNSSGTGITDGVGNAISGGYTSGQIYSIDKTAPTVSSINRLTPSTTPTNLSSVIYRVTFSEDVTGVTSDDFVLTVSGVSGSVASVSAVSGSVYDVTVNTISGDGTLRLDLLSSGTGIIDDIGNAISGGYSAGEVYTIDKTAPSAPTISGITAGYFNTDQTFTVGGEAGATIEYSTNNGGLWTAYSGAVTLSAEGTYNVLARQTDQAGNGPAASGVITLTIDKTTPTVSSINRLTPSTTPTNLSSVIYQVTFSENVSGVDVSDFSLTVTGTSTGSIASVSAATETTIDVTVSSISGDGTLRLDLKSSGTGITDDTGNAISGGYTSGQTYTIDKTAPSAPTISGITAGYFKTNQTFTVDGEAGATIEYSTNNGGLWTAYSGAVTLSAEGTYNVLARQADQTGNGPTASAVITLTIDKTAPSAPTISGITASYFNTDQTFTVGGEAGATIEYSTNNGGLWTAYSGAVTLSAEGTYNVLARQTDQAGNGPAASAVITLTIDKTAPAAPTISGISAGNFNTNQAFTVNGEAGATIEYSTNNGGLWSAYSGEVTLSAEGTYNVLARQTDQTGNGPTASAVITLTIDKTAPAAPTISGISAGYFNTDQTFTVGGEAGATIEYSTNNGGLWTAYSGTVTLSAEGTYNVLARQTDQAGNGPITSGVITLTIDKTTPTVSSINRLTPSTTPTNLSSVIYQVTFSENVSGVDVSDFSLTVTGTSTGSIASVSAATETTIDVTVSSISGDGTLRLDLKSSGTGITDDTGNAISGGYTSGQTYTIDKTAPSAPTITGIATGYFKTNQTFTVDGEAGATIEYSTNNGGLWTAYSGAVTLSAEGTYNVLARQADQTGNGPTASAVITLTIDKTAPSAPTISGITAGYFNTDQTFTVGGEAGATIEYSTNNGGLWTTYSGAVTLSAEGTYNILARQDDQAGNGPTSSGAITLTIDKTAPAAPTISGISAGNFNTNQAFTVNGEAGATIEYSTNNGGLWSAYSGEVTLSAEGTYNVLARQTDQTGNEPTASAVITLTIDKTAPAAPTISGISAGYFNTDQTFTVGGEAGATIEYSTNNGGLWTAYSGTVTLSAEGTYNVLARQTDQAGNGPAASAVITLTIDKTAPSAPTISGITAGYFNTDQTFTVGGEAGATIEYSTNNGGLWTAYSGTVTLSAEGTYNVLARQTDQTGNGPTASGVITLTIDKTTPTVTSISPTSGPTAGNTSIVITGTNFTGAFSVKFGSTNATSFTVDLATQITATSPAGSAGAVDVTVKTAGGTSSISASDKFTYLTPGTWIGVTSSDWTDGSNWSGGTIPTSTTDVVIPATGPIFNPVIFATKTADCNNLTVSAGASLTIESSASGTGSLIVSGTSTGNVIAERYMTGGKWHVVAPIAAGGSISTFIQNSGNAIPLKTTSYAMMDYNESYNNWKSYYTAATTDLLNSGQGYSIRRTTDGIVTFTGSLTSGTKTVTLTKGGTEGWNCVGNPYPSSINMNDDANGTSNFLKTNAAGILDASYACVYVYDDDIKGYKILGNVSYPGRDLGMDVFAPGQGFFVKAASAGASLTFASAIQTHKTDAVLKSAQVTWPAITLSVANEQTSSVAVVAFDSRMTKGLDPTYDAGLLRGSNGLSLYTRLVEDNGVDFAIQCLPESFDNLTIPVGVDYNTGGEITFSAKTIELPLSSTLTLEDKTTGTFTQLTDGATYKATVAAGTNGIGRFYIHASGIVSALPVTTVTSGLKAYLENGSIVITGVVSSSAKAYLFNMNGQNLGTFKLQEGTQNSINASGLVSGVYLLNVIDGKSSFATKIVIY